MRNYISLFAVLLFSVAVAKAQEPNTIVAKEITKAYFLENVNDYTANPDQWKFKGDKPCIIGFSTPWCNPCKEFALVLNDLAVVYNGDIDVYTVNIAHEQDLAAHYQVKSVPSVLIVPMQGEPEMIRKGMAYEDFIFIVEDELLKQD